MIDLKCYHRSHESVYTVNDTTESSLRCFNPHNSLAFSNADKTTLLYCLSLHALINKQISKPMSLKSYKLNISSHHLLGGGEFNVETKLEFGHI